MQLRQYELQARQILAKARVDSPGLCARLLVAYAAGLDKTGYILACDRELEPEQAKVLHDCVARRASGEPLAYILGYKEFYGINFIVNSCTLTPRPETELLVDLALSIFPEQQSVRFADLCCGSGCIGLTLAHMRCAWHPLLLDNSAGALAVCQSNQRNLACPAAIVQADIFRLPLGNECFDLVVSNPPYIAESEKAQVMGETLAHEPHSALFSPHAGLAHLEAVITGAMRCLVPGGYILLEHGARQGKPVQKMLRDSGFTNVSQQNDLAGLPRCAMAQKT